MLRTRLTLLGGLFLLVSGALRAQTASDTISVVNWNLEWWADGSTHNASTQVSRTQQLMAAIGADIYALQEIVNVDSLQAVAKRLPKGPWAAVVSPYASLAASPTASGYSEAQKLALLYRTAIFRNVRARAFLKGNPYSYYDFSSGRYPFLVQGELRARNGAWVPVSFIVLHAKALSDDASCQRRESGSYTLKDSLDQRLPNDRFLLLGDFNDALNKTICTSGGVSAYKNFVDDSSDAVSYRSLTLPLARSGASSVDGYSNLIDNVVASDEMARSYVPGSAQSLRSLVRSIDGNYVKNVSDHYPIRTNYLLDAPGTGIAGATEVALQLVPNPASTHITLAGTGVLQHAGIYDAAGRLVQTVAGARLPLQLDVAGWQTGLYTVQVVLVDGGTWTGRFVKEYY